jgi:phosphonate transport system ATP-binding protein
MGMLETPWAIEVYQLCKTFPTGQALRQVSFRVAPGEMVALIGPSGSGKSTLLRHLSGLVPSDRTASHIALMGERVQHNGQVTAHIRRIRAHVGFIFQQFNLVGRLSLLTNVLVGMLAEIPFWRSMTRCFTYAEKQRAMEVLQRVGMAAYATQRASTLSGGQQQRGAIARAMVQQAHIILADEPIASLDPESSRQVMESLVRLNREDGVTVLVSLHQIDFAMRYCARSIALKNGLVVYDGPTAELTVATLQAIYGPHMAHLYDEAEHPPSVSHPQRPVYHRGYQSDVVNVSQEE